MFQNNNVLWMQWSLLTITNPKVKELIDNYQSKLNDIPESQNANNEFIAFPAMPIVLP